MEVELVLVAECFPVFRLLVVVDLTSVTLAVPIEDLKPCAVEAAPVVVAMDSLALSEKVALS